MFSRFNKLGTASRGFNTCAIASTQQLLEPKFIEPTLQIRNRQLFINNEWVNSLSGQTLDIYDPRNDEIITSVSQALIEDVNIAIDNSYDSFQNGPWYTKYIASERCRILNKWADLIDKHSNDIALIESWDVGKPLSITKVEIPMCANIIRYYAQWSDKINGQTLSIDCPQNKKFISQTYLQPFGVIGVILPWNSPCKQFLMHAAMSLSFGNTMVAKVAETSPLSALYCANLAAEAGIPNGVLNVVTGYGPIAGQQICRNKKISKISFTGESITGKKIMKTASDNLIPVCLELGGKSPCIIFPDADIDIAIRTTQHGTFLNAGQVCCASSRIFVHESIYDEFVEKTIVATSARKIGDNLSSEENVDQGPQQNKQQFEKVMRHIKCGKDQGADLLIGGHSLYDKGNFIASTVFGNVSDNMCIAKNEIFGPCMQLLKYNDNVKNYDIDKVLQRANDTKYGLAAGVITNDTNIINKCRKKLQAGTVWINCWNALFPQTPFGGCKESGFGRVGGPYAIENFTKVQVQTQLIN